MLCTSVLYKLVNYAYYLGTVTTRACCLPTIHSTAWPRYPGTSSALSETTCMTEQGLS